LGGDDYINCPLSREQYEQFVTDLLEADKVAGREFEKLIHFEGCMPIEEIAARGRQTLSFGPMKPVGLPDPRTGYTPYAVIQLRQDNRNASSYNLVGFQTRMTYPEQKRIFRSIPGLENARFERLGSMHRNTFINAPKELNPRLQLHKAPHITLAGQISGVEGYVESAACGLLAGIFVAAEQLGLSVSPPPAVTALGALLQHLHTADADNFQPSNVNYGLFPPLVLERKIKRADRRLAMAERALAALPDWWQEIETARNTNADQERH
jgi:methylenetetrahydrofolate--tRNA-(uracil-5-)-methyltransferase